MTDVPAGNNDSTTYSTVFDIQKMDASSSVYLSESQDQLAIEEPLEILLQVKDRKAFSIGITMRTPGEDLDLITGLLFSEGIIKQYSDIHSIDFTGPITENYGLKNQALVKIDSDQPLDEKKFQRYFLTTSSCGICGKTAIETLALLHCPEFEASKPSIESDTLFQLSATLKKQQVQFSTTGGQHAVGLYKSSGELMLVREDIGRHNAMDKLIGSLLRTGFNDFTTSLLCLSGRASFELVQKALMANIPFIAAVGAPSSLSVELARKHNMTLVGFLKNYSYNVYSGSQRLIEEQGCQRTSVNCLAEKA
ncbi:MAG: formate dehydrogenase family accessory protein FdhD [Moraxellaceae bacterium]|nr:MAG: formate dehydrogenase family accessory protein FdhD [Moraxellaceae bacterium]